MAYARARDSARLGLDRGVGGGRRARVDCRSARPPSLPGGTTFRVCRSSADEEGCGAGTEEAAEILLERGAGEALCALRASPDALERVEADAGLTALEYDNCSHHRKGEL